MQLGVWQGGGDETDYVIRRYLRPQTAWVDLTDVDLAIIGHCSSGTPPNGSAIHAAFKCHAQEVVGFYGNGLYAPYNQADVFLDGFWQKWTDGWSASRAAVYAEKEMRTRFGLDPFGDDLGGIRNIRVFYPGWVTVIPTWED